jgi:hypothetical protein
VNRIIDTMPTLTEVENADRRSIVDWYLHLRPTMFNEELVIVKLIARRYESMAASERERWTTDIRRRGTP